MIRNFAACNLLLLLLLLPSDSEAFDGDRKGFVFGLGAGVAPVTKWSDLSGRRKNTLSGFAFNIVVGHGFGPKDLVVWSVLGATHPSGAFANVDLTFQGMSGIQWYHFMSNEEQSFYTSVGFGVMVFQSGLGSDRQGGMGFKGEVGYEFGKHLMIGTYGVLGQTRRREDSLRHKQFGILLRLLAY